VAYIAKALEKGRRSRFESLHLNSIMPAHQIAQFFNANRGKDTAPASPKDFLVFEKLAHSEKEIKFSGEIISTVQEISKGVFPVWIRKVLPWGQLMEAKTLAEPAKPLFWCCKEMFVIAPKVIQGWIDIELGALKINKEDVGKVVTLYDIENTPQIDIKLPMDFGWGYCENERFKILKFHEAPKKQEDLANA